MIPDLILATTAINLRYETEAARLKRCVGDTLQTFKTSSDQYQKQSDDPLIDGLYHKTNFANYVEGDLSHPVLFMDADLFSVYENPLETFEVDLGTDIAYVPYTGTFHYPDALRQEAFAAFNYKINSGFVYFKSLQFAREICDEWREKYLERSQINKFEYDELALMYVLKDKSLNVQQLPLIWNNWYYNDKLNNMEPIYRKATILANEENCIFYQSHDPILYDVV